MEESDEERIERLVSESKMVADIVEFANSDGVVENVARLSEQVIVLATKFKRETGLSEQEVVSALIGSLSGVLAGWAIAINELED